MIAVFPFITVQQEHGLMIFGGSILNLCRCCSIIGNQPQVRKLKAGVAMVWSIDSRLMDRVRTIVQLEAQLIAHSSLPKGSIT